MKKWSIGDAVWVRWELGGEREQATVVDVTKDRWIMVRFTDGVEWPVYNHQLSSNAKKGA